MKATRPEVPLLAEVPLTVTRDGLAVAAAPLLAVTAAPLLAVTAAPLLAVAAAPLLAGRG